jgi:hypothetical protein
LSPPIGGPAHGAPFTVEQFPSHAAATTTAAAGSESVNHDVGGSVSLPRLWFETDGRTDSATASTVPSPAASIDVRAHMITSSQNISLSTTNGIGRSVNLKGIIVALRLGVLHFSAS